jgi:hypothetical protein
MMKAHLCAVFAATLVCLSASQAQSLKDREYFAAQEKSLADDLAQTSKQCGTDMTAKFDWLNVPIPAAGQPRYSPSAYCGAVFGGIRRVCGSQLGKEAVKKIKSLNCGFGAQRSIAMKDGTIDYTINYQSSNDVDFVFAYLQSNL